MEGASDAQRWAEEKRAFQIALHRVSVTALVALSRISLLPPSANSPGRIPPSPTSSGDSSQESLAAAALTPSPAAAAAETPAAASAATAAAIAAAATAADASYYSFRRKRQISSFTLEEDEDSTSAASRRCPAQRQHTSPIQPMSPADPSLSDSLPPPDVTGNRSAAAAAEAPRSGLHGILVVPGCNCNLCRWATQVNYLTAGNIFHPLCSTTTPIGWLANGLASRPAAGPLS